MKDCTIHRTMDFIGKKWTLLILLELYKGNKYKRYSQLKNSLPEITPKMLSARLKELKEQKLINKKVTEFPLKCDYSLTDSGEDFIRIIKDIKKWSLKWKFNNQICKSIDCKECTL